MHRLLRKQRHQRLGNPPSARTSRTISVQRFKKEWKQLSNENVKPIGCDVRPVGSVMESPPDDDEAGSRPLQHQHTFGQIADEPKAVDYVGGTHPGPRVPLRKMTARDQQWKDIGSGMVARTFKRVSNLRTTSPGGPCMDDIFRTKIWSLSTGKVIDDC